jgi:hypothetical protein
MPSTNDANVLAVPLSFEAVTSQSPIARRCDMGDVAAPPSGYWWATLGLLCAVLLFPLLLTDVPPVLDYPNHLARLMVLADHGADPILARFYRSNWGVIPDLAIDVIGPPLIWFLPVHVAGRIVLGIVLLVPVLGTVAYSRAAFGRFTWWSLGCVLVVYNATYLQGFLNFTVGTGIALLLAAAWIQWRESAPLRALAIAIAGAVLLFFCHLMGLLFYGLLIGVHELVALPALRRQPRAIVLRVLYGVAVFAVPAALYLSSELQAMPGETEYVTVAKKAAELLMPFANYSLPLDIATLVLVTGLLVLGATTRHLLMPARSVVTILLLTLLYLATPAGFKGTYNLDMRFVIFLGFVLFAAVAPVALPRRTEKSIMVGMAVLFVVRMMVLSSAWAAHNDDLAQLRSVIAHVEPGSLVFIADVKPEEEPDYWNIGHPARRLSNGLRMDVHLPALLLIERRAYWPFLFDNPSQQPVRTRQPYRALSDGIVHLPPHRDLEVPGKVSLCGFDSVLLMQAGGARDAARYASDRLIPIAVTDTAALYRIRPDPTCPPLK